MFDPFRDFETAGYLRNVEGLKDPEEIRMQEALFFEAHLEEAIFWLRRKRSGIGYDDYLKVHQILFGGFYPWAGQDRQTLGVARLVSKGGRIRFVAAEECRSAVEWGLRLGNNATSMRASPGKVMGAFAWGHPFLDGNGRTMFLVHAELCARAQFAIDWRVATGEAYLTALTKELEQPANTALDTYLSPLTWKRRSRQHWLKYCKELPGMEGVEGGREGAKYRAEADTKDICQNSGVKCADFTAARR